MIFKQFYHSETFTYTYLLASAKGREAIIIDPIDDDIEEYLTFLHTHKLKLVSAIDTHMHADHITALPELRRRTECMTIAHKLNGAAKLARRIDDGDTILAQGLRLEVLYTPGHTNDSCCYYEKSKNMLFTGDTLLIRGCGRTDFQSGDSAALYDSIINRLFLLPDSVNIYPCHDYKGENISTIGIERLYNNRLSGKTKAEFIELMEKLHLELPSLMHTAIALNSKVGSGIDSETARQNQITANELDLFIEQNSPIIIDVRALDEIRNYGTIATSFNFPYEHIEKELASGGILDSMLASNKSLLFICAYGDRSSLVLNKIDPGRRERCYHLQGGVDTLIAHDYPLVFKCVDFEGTLEDSTHPKK